MFHRRPEKTQTGKSKNVVTGEIRVPVDTDTDEDGTTRSSYPVAGNKPGLTLGTAPVQEHLGCSAMLKLLKAVSLHFIWDNKSDQTLASGLCTPHSCQRGTKI